MAQAAIVFTTVRNTITISPGPSDAAHPSGRTHRVNAATLSAIIARDRRPQHLLDPRSACGQHHQPVEAERNAAGRRHLLERREEVAVDRILLAVAPLPLG